MRKSRFTETQIVKIAERGRGRSPGQRGLPGVRRVRCHVLQLEIQIWLYRGV